MLSITNNISVDELQYLFPIGKIQRERIYVYVLILGVINKFNVVLVAISTYICLNNSYLYIQLIIVKVVGVVVFKINYVILIREYLNSNQLMNLIWIKTIIRTNTIKLNALTLHNIKFFFIMSLPVFLLFEGKFMENFVLNFLTLDINTNNFVNFKDLVLICKVFWATKLFYRHLKKKKKYLEKFKISHLVKIKGIYSDSLLSYNYIKKSILSKTDYWKLLTFDLYNAPRIFNLPPETIPKFKFIRNMSKLRKFARILETTLDHSELHNIGGINVTKCLNEIPQLSKTNEKKPGQIFAELVSKVDRKTKSLILAREINNPINFHFLNELRIENDWCSFRYKSIQFLLHYIRIDATEQRTIFATYNGLIELRKNVSNHNT
ncbi:hypothetical protein AGLY_006422 [Aphis glycines]|uniref:EF-hand domain-containing protein n=1 Tax=Aphis glycines TaxID=307491 RepID=A0A6G0TRX2_APHGL|nr:hypothetical protein AGLY_006422 [Aphis glycines]